MSKFIKDELEMSYEFDEEAFRESDEEAFDEKYFKAKYYDICPRKHFF